MNSSEIGPAGERLPSRAVVAVGMIVGALVPAVMAVALFASAAFHRPALARIVRPSRGPAAARLTIAWALALTGIAAVQAAGALIGLGSISSPVGLAARTGFGLAAEAVLLVATAVYLTRPTRQLG
jgi:hypothetical protein